MREKEPSVKKEDLISKDHAARMLGTSRAAVGRWITAGALDTKLVDRAHKVYRTGHGARRNTRA